MARVRHVLERVGELGILEAAAVVRLGKGKKRGLTAGAFKDRSFDHGAKCTRQAQPGSWHDGTDVLYSAHQAPVPHCSAGGVDNAAELGDGFGWDAQSVAHGSDDFECGAFGAAGFE